MELTIHIFLVFVWTTTLLVFSEQTYYEPSTTYPDLQDRAKITASSRCNTNACQSGCVNTKQRPQMTDQIQVNPACKVSKNSLPSTPASASVNDAFMSVNDSLTCDRNTPVSGSSADGYSMTTWIRLNLQPGNITLFSIGSIIFTIDDSRTVCINNRMSNLTLNQDTWYLIAFRYDIGGTVSIVVLYSRNTLRQTYISTVTLPSTINTISWTPGVSSSGTLNMGDFRFYNDYLTNRDIQMIYDANYVSKITEPGCRCPKYYQDIVPNDPEGRLCQSYTGNKTLRLNSQAHFPVFAIDGDLTTSWRSKELTSNNAEEMLTITLEQIYMIENIKIQTNGSIPENIIIELIRGNGQSNRQEFPSPALINNFFTWTLRNVSNLPAASNVSAVEELTAKSIRITLKGQRSSVRYYQIPQIRITGRCYCSGLSNSCSRNTDSRTYRCLNCVDSQGASCENCIPTRYRPPNTFECKSVCSCYAPGTSGNHTLCDQDGGQCTCKSNVMGRDCNICKDLYYNLTANGCQKCSCDVYGTASCDKSTGVCTCKPNTETDTCNRCISKYYGRNRTEGCIPCDCNNMGTQNSTECSEFTGQCQCKQSVMGRTCDTCKDQFHNLDRNRPEGCLPCSCNKGGSMSNVCNKGTGQCTCRAGVDITTSPLCIQKLCLTCSQISEAELKPNFGPVAGGTKVTLKGFFFGNTTRNTEVSMGTSIYYPVDKVNNTYLEFTTEPHALGESEISIRWTNQNFPGEKEPSFTLKKFTFQFRSNPRVSKVSSITAFKSGGCAVLIEGTGLDSVANIKMIIYDKSTLQEIVKTDCIYSAADLGLRCMSPKLGNVGEVTYGLYMDGVMMYQNLSSFQSNNIKIVADPVVNKVQGDKTFKAVFSSTFSIRGDSLDTACADGDFSVDCGPDIACSVVKRTSSSVECKPDISFPGISSKVKLKLKIGDTEYEAQEIEFMTFWSTTEFIGIAIGAVVLIVLIIGAIILIKCCCSRRVHSQSSEFNKLTADSKDTDLHLINMNGMTSNSNEMPTMERQPARPNSYEGVKLDKENWQTFIHLLNESVRKQVDFSHTDMTDIEPGRRCINKGDQIRVIDGRFKKGTSNVLAGRPCILKTMVNEYSSFESALLPQWISNGIQECLKFRDCVHDNFLHIKGVSSDEKRCYVIYPSYHRLFKDYLNDKAIQNPLRDLLQFCLQIADGVQYLHENNIVHKDLATRNCVIDENNIVKLSDSAFSWNLYPNDYMYDDRRERFLPVRWMALESLMSGFYDSSSDIWSLGVLIWEVMYEANSLPYPDITDDKAIKDHVSSGFRLGKSVETPEQLYTLMLRCWESSSENRVPIQTVIDTLAIMIDPDNFGQDGLYINEDETLDLYQNTSFENPAFKQ